MTLIKSISGIRGTIGGKAGENLSPLDIVIYTSAFAKLIRDRAESNTIVVGRDARTSGEMVEMIVNSCLMSMGFDVVSIGLATTPTTEIAVLNEKAAGGIIITASHNPGNWNALKLLNSRGEFLNSEDGDQILKIAHETDFIYQNVENIGSIIKKEAYEDFHINKLLSLEIINTGLIKQAGFRVAIDCVNSVGGIAVPKLLRELGVDDIIELYCTPNGMFPHNPEPLPENLGDISNLIKEKKADVGFVFDPDVDRLAIICEDGSMFGEEYTLVSIADYILSKTPGNTVSNLSSTRALKDITERYGMNYFASAVGEVNVVEMMKSKNAVIGGEGNGGVIYPKSHYGRDALVGVALFLSLMAEKKIKVSEIKKKLPQYYISKNKIELNENTNIDEVLAKIAELYSEYPILTIDGLRIDFPQNKEWVHMRKSNTEPIIRIYAESPNKSSADMLAEKIIEKIKNI
jgi:phosphomannomutase